MKTNKLFKVLVLGGAMLVANSIGAEENTSTPPPEESLAPIFCAADNPETCAANQCGKLDAPKGFFCCWNTSCEPAN